MTSLVLLPCHVKPLFINVHEAVDTKGMFGWASAPPKTTPAPAPLEAASMVELKLF